MKESSVMVLTLALVVSPILPHVMASSPSPPPAGADPPGPSSTLTIEVDPSVPRTDSIQQILDVSGQEQLTSIQPHFVTEDRIFVRISGEQYDYHIQAYTTRRDVQIDENTMSCACSDTELEETVDAEIRRAAALLAATPAATQKPSVTMAAEEEDPQDQALAPKKPPPPQKSVPEVSPGALQPIERAAVSEPVPHGRPVRRTKLAGVTALIAGSALLFVGAAMAFAGSRDLLDDWPHYKRDWRPSGFAVGGVGIIGIAVGGSLMIIDDVRCRRRPHSCTSSARSARRFGFTQLFMRTRR